MQTDLNISLPLLNLLLNTPNVANSIENQDMRNYLESLATYIESEATDVKNAAYLLRERKLDFED